MRAIGYLVARLLLGHFRPAVWPAIPLATIQQLQVMKLDKDTYLLAQDVYLRTITNPNYKGNDQQTAVQAIKSSVTFFGQWEAMQAQVAAAANNVVSNATPAPEPESLKEAIKKANGERQKLSHAPVKELRSKASSKAPKAPAKAHRKAKGKGKR